jgi:hypothetical protein
MSAKGGVGGEEPGREGAVIFEVFFPCSLTGTITHIVVGNLVPLYKLW